MMMHNMGLPGLVMMALILVVVVIPFWRLLPKFGINKWVSLLAIVPVAPLILLWIIAFMEPKATSGSEARA